MPRYFWLDKKWPFDTADFIFLGRAVDRIGTAIFPGDWDGHEFSEGGEHLIPENIAGADATQRAYVSKRLAEAFPDYSPQTRTISPPSLNRTRAGIEQEEPSPTDWLRGLALLEAETSQIKGRLVRRAAVMRAVAENASTGRLKFAVRLVKGGSIESLPAEAWHIEKWDHRFQYCQIKPASPFGLDPGGEGAQYVGFAYLFVSKASLASFESLQRRTPEEYEQPHAAPHAVGHADLSPYMSTLLAVSANLAISPTNQPKKEALKADIKAEWKHPFPLSARLLDAMATILRQPESQAGKNKLNNG